VTLKCISCLVCVSGRFNCDRNNKRKDMGNLCIPLIIIFKLIHCKGYILLVIILVVLWWRYMGSNMFETHCLILIVINIYFLGWKSLKVYHIGWKGPSIYYNLFLPYMIPIKNNESKVVKHFKKTIFSIIIIINSIIITHKCVFTW